MNLFARALRTLLVKQNFLSNSHYSRSVFTPGKCNLVTAKLDSRAIIRVKGQDTLEFLQGVITNDIHHLETRPAIYALLLNHQGRVLYDTIIYSTNASDEVLIECDKAVQSGLIKHLRIYRVRKKVEVTDATELTENLWVVFDPAHKYVCPKSLADDSSSVISNREIDNEVCCSPLVVHSSKRQELPVVRKGVEGIGDPRLEELGWRVFLPPNEPGAGQEFTQEVQVVREEEYRELRYSLGVGEGTGDLPPGNCFPLESNGDYLHGISFQKGCYIGQELTARTHHTGVVRKRLMPFSSLTSNISLPEGTDVASLKVVDAEEKILGKVRGICGSKGLVLARVEDALSSSTHKVLDNPVTIYKPLWWPVEASKESQLGKK